MNKIKINKHYSIKEISKERDLEKVEERIWNIFMKRYCEEGHYDRDEGLIHYNFKLNEKEILDMYILLSYDKNSKFKSAKLLFYSENSELIKKILE